MAQSKKQNKHKNGDSYTRESARKMVSRSAENVAESSSDSDPEELRSASPNQRSTGARTSRNVSANTSSLSVADKRLYSSIQKTTTTTTATGTSTTVFPKPLFILALVAGVAVIVVGIASNSNASKLDMVYMRDTYPWQAHDTWDTINAVINDIGRPSAIHPAVFLFLADANNSHNISDLVHDLATYVSEKLDSGGDFIELAANEFVSDEAVSDYGYLIDKYAQPMAEKKVMVVQDLQNIPGHVAQAFHSFCDEISPLVESVVYIFTLQVSSLHGKKEALAEYQLKQSWRDLDEDKLLPLITRVTGSVF